MREKGTDPFYLGTVPKRSGGPPSLIESIRVWNRPSHAPRLS